MPAKPDRSSEKSPRSTQKRDPERTKDKATTRIDELQKKAGHGKEHAGGSPGDTPNARQPDKPRE